MAPRGAERSQGDFADAFFADDDFADFDREARFREDFFAVDFFDDFLVEDVFAVERFVARFLVDVLAVDFFVLRRAPPLVLVVFLPALFRPAVFLELFFALFLVAIGSSLSREIRCVPSASAERRSAVLHLRPRIFQSDRAIEHQRARARVHSVADEVAGPLELIS